jgi:hypothetical protein
MGGVWVVRHPRNLRERCAKGVKHARHVCTALREPRGTSAKAETTAETSVKRVKRLAKCRVPRVRVQRPAVHTVRDTAVLMGHGRIVGLSQVHDYIRYR